MRQKVHKVDGDSMSVGARETSRQSWEHTGEKRGNTHSEIDTKERMNILSLKGGSLNTFQSLLSSQVQK